MIRCKIINLLFRVFPLRAFQGFLIKNHHEKCPDCQNSLAKIEETRLIVVKEQKSGEQVSLWPGIREKICENSEEKIKTPFILQWKWALSAASLTVFILTGFLYLNRTKSTEMAFQQDLNESLQINFLKVREQPAEPFLYEPQDSEMIIVWAEIIP